MCKITAISVVIYLVVTYVYVGHYNNDYAEIFSNSQGNPTTPSCRALRDSESLIVGSDKVQSALNPDNIIFDAKGLVGRKFDDPEVVQKNKEHWLFKLVNDSSGKPVVQVTFEGEENIFTPEEKMREDVESGETVTDAVVTIPATKDSGKIVVKLIERNTRAIAEEYNEKWKTLANVVKSIVANLISNLWKYLVFLTVVWFLLLEFGIISPTEANLKRLSKFIVQCVGPSLAIQVPDNAAKLFSIFITEELVFQRLQYWFAV